MYNENQKQRFIEYKIKNGTTERKIIEYPFDAVCDFEEEKQKDICNFTVNEIFDVYRILNASLNTLITINCSLSTYTQWALQEGLVLDNQNHFKVFDYNELLKCVNVNIMDKQIFSREEFISFIEKLNNPRDKFIMLALFEFGSGTNFYKDIYSVRMSDIDVQNQTIKLSNRTVKISKKLIEIAQESDETLKYFYDCPATNRESRSLIDNGTIIKTFSMKNMSDRNRGATVYNALKKIFSMLGLYKIINAKVIEESGKLDMIKRKSNELNISAIDYLIQHREDIEFQYDCPRIVIKRYVNKYKDYL